MYQGLNKTQGISLFKAMWIGRDMAKHMHNLVALCGEVVEGLCGLSICLQSEPKDPYGRFRWNRLGA